MSLHRLNWLHLLALALCVGMIAGCQRLPRRRQPPRQSAPPKPVPETEVTPRSADPNPAPELRIPISPRGQSQAPTAHDNDPASPGSPRAHSETTPRVAGDENLQQLRRVYHESAKEYAKLHSFIVRLTRQEWGRNKLQPAEILLMKFRKTPYSIYFKWLGDEHKGREVLFVEGQYQSKIHTRVAAGDIPFVRAGKVMSFSPDSALVKANARHDIRESGIGQLIVRFRDLLEGMEKGDKTKGTLKYLGEQQRTDLEEACECVAMTIPPGVEGPLPKGGKRWFYLYPKNHLPALIVTQDDKGNVVEYYRYDHYQYPVMLDDDDFNPDVLWSKTKGSGR